MTTRRRVLQAGGALFLSSITDLASFAEESYPAREVHVIAAYPPGSGADVFTRYFAENMRPFLGGTIVVENKVGASGNLALIYVSKPSPTATRSSFTRRVRLPPTSRCSRIRAMRQARSTCSARCAGCPSRSAFRRTARTRRCRA